MKKKLFFITIVSTLFLTACSNTENQSAIETTAAPAVTADPNKEVPEEKDAADKEGDLNGAQTNDTANDGEEMVDDVTIEKGLFDVTLTIPPTYVEGVTQDNLDELSQEKGYQSITLNEDGSVTYVMTKDQHKMMMDEMRVQINKQLSLLIGSENYSNFTKITSDENYTTFEVTTKSVKLDMAESFSPMVFYMYGGMYNYFNGSPVDSITVTYKNAATGEVIAEENSKNME